jgi:predicted DNA-binding transcriptional regulator YafY
MRRADRLFAIVDHLARRRRATTAANLAERLEVSERTIYRDLHDLMRSGVAIRGEAGVGYVLERDALPPLGFEHEEIEAVVLGLRMVESWTDPDLARAARRALDRVGAALSKDRRELIETTRLYAPGGKRLAPLRVSLGTIRAAIRDRRRLAIDYQDEQGRRTQRVVEPLGLFFFGPVWVLAAWCTLREDFRAFRLDRIDTLQDRGAFSVQPGKTFEDFARCADRD